MLEKVDYCFIGKIKNFKDVEIYENGKIKTLMSIFLKNNNIIVEIKILVLVSAVSLKPLAVLVGCGRDWEGFVLILFQAMSQRHKSTNKGIRFFTSAPFLCGG